MQFASKGNLNRLGTALAITACVILSVTAVLTNTTAAQQPETPGATAPSPELEGILGHVEDRYSVPGFSAKFFQTSTLKAMGITDEASGQIFIKKPGKMRWEYTAPEKQAIISDGVQLWIFRPDDNQVMVGKAPDFFGDGKGASFLSDIRKMRGKFQITLEKRSDTANHILKLVPHSPEIDLAKIFLSVSPKTFVIEEITTVNAYGDETRIELRDAVFDRQLGDDLFEFTTPPGVEVLDMGQQEG